LNKNQSNNAGDSNKLIDLNLEWQADRDHGLVGYAILDSQIEESAMHATEFEADIENGVIRIPDIYRNLYCGERRVLASPF
jgi:hypothetical protein